MAILSSCQKKETTSFESPYPISPDSFSTEVIAEGFTIPFGLAVISPEEFLVSDRIGKIYHITNGKVSEVFGGPEVLTFEDPGLPWITHGGMMDLSIHPNYPEVPFFYVAYLGKDSKARVDRFIVQDNIIIAIESIFTSSTEGHYGNAMRIVWQGNNRFFLNLGGTTLSTKENPDLLAQNLDEDWGKIHKIGEDGTVPLDNPIIGDSPYPTSIFSYGHRDVQGLFYDDQTGILYGIEQGPKGGDEFNVIDAGINYGWPLFTYGTHYDGSPVSLISKDSAEKISKLPEFSWTVPTPGGGQAIAPSSAILVKNSSVPEWDNNFLIGSLAFRRLLKYKPETQETFGLDLQGRVRTLKQLPNGDILALIERSEIGEEDGKLIRITGKK